MFEMHKADSFQQASNAARRDRDRRHLGAHTTSSGRGRVILGIVVVLAAAGGLYLLMAPPSFG
jgi:hypothetical protein